MEGLYGPLLITPHPSTGISIPLGPIKAEYTISFADFYHNKTAQMMAWYKSPASQGNEPVPDSGLLNGRGHFNCSLTSKPCKALPYERFKIKPGQRYWFHVINSAAFSAIRFSIDGHKLRVVSIDLTPIKPVVVDVMSINVGQRVSFVLEPSLNSQVNHKKNFWIRATMETACYAYTNPNLDPNVKAILEYNPAVTTNPTSKAANPQLNQNCRLLDYLSLRPRIPMNVPKFRPGIDLKQKFNFIFRNNAQGVNYAYVNGNSYNGSNSNPPTMSLVAQNPTLKFPNGTSIFSPSQNAFILPDRPQPYWVFLTINNYDSGEHPFHKHNSAVFLLGEGRDGPFSWTNAKQTSKLRYANPLRRDTFTVPFGAGKYKAGWAVLAWPVTDPGVWVFHCHIEFHVAVGLFAQFVQMPNAIAEKAKSWPRDWSRCAV